jgi:predicted transcriptional regulator
MGDGAIETVANGSILPASALSPDEMAVLQFAQRRGHVTASDLIQQLHLSRATATRRLAGLVEKGHLQAAGKGRGSYYRPLEKTKIAQMAESALDLPRTETSVEALRVQLVRQRQELEQDFALAALGLVLPLETSLPFCRMVVRFRHLPDLSGYFALKERLSRLLQREVDLLPQGVATSQRFGDAEWLWGG